MAANPRPSSDAIQSMLSETNFGDQGGVDLPFSDPLTTTQFILSLAEIKPFDRNPRKERNPLYDQIKASIRSTKKLITPFKVTRRPGDEVFMIKAGGNTRLSILNELYLETGDEVFNQIDCFFDPWVSDSRMISEHLIENVMHGEMLLIDKAHATSEFKKALEKELQQEVSSREFTRLIAEVGYHLSRRNITRMEYAVELDKMIPVALRHGFGARNIDELKKIHRGYKAYSANKTDNFDAVFSNVMSSQDGEDFSIEVMRKELDEALSEVTGVRSNLLRLQVDAELFNDVPSHDSHTSDQESFKAINIEPSVNIDHECQQDARALIHATPPTEIMPDTQIERAQTVNSDNNNKVNLADPLALANTLIAVEPLDLQSLRGISYDLASKIARDNQLESVILPVDNGLGFIVECLDHPFRQDEVAKYLMWWMLVGLSEQDAGLDLHGYAWAHTHFFRLNQESGIHQNDKLIQWLGHPPSIKEVMCNLLQNNEILDDKTFSELLKLITHLRAMKRNYPENEIWVARQCV